MNHYPKTLLDYLRWRGFVSAPGPFGRTWYLLHGPDLDAWRARVRLTPWGVFAFDAPSTSFHLTEEALVARIEQHWWANPW